MGDSATHQADPASSNAISTSKADTTSSVAAAAPAKKPAATLGRPPGSTNEPRNKRKKYVFNKECTPLNGA
ncbi:hypothetical protein BGZ98_003413 [Dissophora globulifera]|nr:hypothetical protein BGZ98_003413 [Dissophora globulifera]